jgi:hypothetical protein
LQTDGRFYYHDKPLTGGTVLFVPAAGGGSFPATIDAEGNYSITKIPTGLAKIAVDSGPAHAAHQGLRAQKNRREGKMAPPKESARPKKGPDPWSKGAGPLFDGGRQR